MHEGGRPYHPAREGRDALDWSLVGRREEVAVHRTADETPQPETSAESPGDLPVSRRRFLGLSAAWAVAVASFAAAGCGGEEDEDEGGEDED